MTYFTGLLQDRNVICNFSQTYFNSGAFSYRTSPGTTVSRKTFVNTKLHHVHVSYTDGTPQAFYFLLMVLGISPRPPILSPPSVPYGQSLSPPWPAVGYDIVQ